MHGALNVRHVVRNTVVLMSQAGVLVVLRHGGWLAIDSLFIGERCGGCTVFLLLISLLDLKIHTLLELLMLMLHHGLRRTYGLFISPLFTLRRSISGPFLILASVHLIVLCQTH